MSEKLNGCEQSATSNCSTHHNGRESSKRQPTTADYLRESWKNCPEFDKSKIEAALKSNANEFLILAQATLLNLYNPNRIEDARRYFLASLKSFDYAVNREAYERFLKSYNLKDESD